MPKPLNLDDYEEVTGAASTKPLDLDQYEEVTKPAAPAPDDEPTVTPTGAQAARAGVGWSAYDTADPANRGQPAGVPEDDGSSGAGGGSGRTEELKALATKPPEPAIPAEAEGAPSWSKTATEWWDIAAKSDDPKEAAWARHALEEIAATAPKGSAAQKFAQGAVPTLTNAKPRDVTDDIAEAKEDVANASQLPRMVRNIGERISRLPGDAIAAPFEAAADPAGALQAPLKGAADVASLGASDPRVQLGKAYKELAELQSMPRPENAEHAAAIERLTEAARRKVAALEPSVRESDRHALLQTFGGVAGMALGAESAAANAVERGIQASTFAGKTLRSGLAAGTAGFVGGTGRALVAGESLPEALQQGGESAATSAGLGIGAHVATAGVSKVAEGAAKRIENREVGALLKGVPKGTADKSLGKLGGKAGLAKTLKDEGLPAKLGPQELAEATEQVRNEVGGQLSGVYKGVDQVGKGVQGTKLMTALNKVKEEWKKAGDPQAVAAIEAEQNGLLELYGPSDKARLTAENLHGITQRLGARGYGQNVLKVSRAQELARDMHDAVRDVLHDYVDDVAKANPGLVGKAQLQDLNRRYSNLKSIQDIADEGARRAEAGRKTLGEKFMDAKNAMADITGGGLAATALASGHGLKSALPLALPLAVRAAPYVAAGADRALVNLALLARNGTVAPSAVAAALQAGASREDVRDILNRAGQANVPLPEEPAPGPTALGY